MLIAAGLGLGLREWGTRRAAATARPEAAIALMIVAASLLSVVVGWVGLHSPLRNLIVNFQPYRVFGTAVPLLVALSAAAVASTSRADLARGGAPIAALVWTALFLALRTQSPGLSSGIALGLATTALVWAAARVVVAKVNRSAGRPGGSQTPLPAAAVAAMAILAVPPLILLATVLELLGIALLVSPLLAALLIAPPTALLIGLRVPPRALRPGRIVLLIATGGLFALVAVAGLVAALRADHAVPVVTRASNPALRDAGRWIQHYSHPNDLVAAPAEPLFRALRCATWRRTTYAGIEEASVFYDPTMLASWRENDRLYGPDATDTPENRNVWIERVCRDGAAFVLLPSGALPPPTAPLVRGYDNGVVAIWRRTSDPR
jgi:hypothetical protein